MWTSIACALGTFIAIAAAAYLRGPTACCHLHHTDPPCCDPEDCGPCCDHCPTCPTLTTRSTT